MATTTPNFGFDIPQSTDLVKDGATAIAALGTDIDTAFVDLKGGTTGQVLSKASNTDLDFTWVAQDDSNAIQNAIVDAKGDLISATAADTPARLPVGSNGQVLTADSTEATGLKWATPSSGATNWTARAGLTGLNYIRFFNNLYVGAGQNGVLITSTDGITWTSRTSGFGSNEIRDVYFGNGLWVAVGGNGTITTSTDGITWTARTSNMGSNNINAVIYANSLWVAVGAGGSTTNTGGITYSTDGITWTRKSQSLANVGDTYNSVVWNGTNWIVGANNSTNNHLYASTPSGTWTVGATGSGGDCFVLAWDGTRHITLEGGSGDIRFSTSTTLGSTTQVDSMRVGTAASYGNKKYFYYYNGRIYYGRAGFLADASTVPTLSLTSSAYYFVDQSIKEIMPGNITTTQNPDAYYVGAEGKILFTANNIFTSF